jgi:hypothetical protein
LWLAGARAEADSSPRPGGAAWCKLRGSCSVERDGRQREGRFWAHPPSGDRASRIGRVGQAGIRRSSGPCRPGTTAVMAMRDPFETIIDRPLPGSQPIRQARHRLPTTDHRIDGNLQHGSHSLLAQTPHFHRSERRNAHFRTPELGGAAWAAIVEGHRWLVARRRRVGPGLVAGCRP